ncbi:bifunctional 3'-5' exonuclease/DNA polymerase [Microbacterium sediminis]|uniref:DNA-directed DNA polymerase n=1 Tax=Microbacterium sediminis TaxID=904291 RepID=A0A1B9NGL7_9MICO|nr:bifunctional 3'-5' exonuclease/DNA polymerase [Microbacterium sediminis]OCG75761.1 bifunctional 3'-5' exonuclease/DNA polymerase [Microbacterium sediminis]QBR74154.1 bifunctional 3'-5' exonuclease/DNA polymerase [Microbacterium sediminis]
MASGSSDAPPPVAPWDAADRIVLGRTPGGAIVAVALDREGAAGRRPLSDAELPAWVALREAEAARAGRGVRWIWSGSAEWYPRLLAAGVRVSRCHDLRLCRAILALAVPDPADTRDGGWDEAVDDDAPDALFEIGGDAPRPSAFDRTLAEYERQEAALARAADPGRLRLLLAAESAGSLVAAELRAAGLPWDADRHDALLRTELGERIAGGTPARIAQTAAAVRAALGDPAASLDSQPKLLRALHRAGVRVESTSKWELAEHDHPVIEPLLEYKRLMRLYTANGWAWLAEWVRDGRFRPVYVPGGVVTGRWASSGGGALQIPRGLRDAVRADPGWVMIDADVAQLEPRVLAAMARDERMAAAAGSDLYEGVVASGAVATRAEAKVAMLGALYGSTTGDSGRLVPRLRQVFPRAMALVDAAAREGERGGQVSTWLGRVSPAPSAAWLEAQRRASDGAADEQRARRLARDQGRFTRNFVVQGTAAEWALAWLADLRARLAAIPPVPEDHAARASGPVFARRPHLAFFLHDEVMVHAPAERAEEAADAIRGAAEAAGRLLFGSFPIAFPLDVRIGRSVAKD